MMRRSSASATNMQRVHGSLRVTPAMEAGIAGHVWELSELIKRLMLCEEKGRLLDAYVTATDRQAEAVKSLSAVAAKDNRRAFSEALVHAEQARQDAERARLALHLHSETHGC